VELADLIVVNKARPATARSRVDPSNGMRAAASHAT
jgi:hypothetical protein